MGRAPGDPGVAARPAPESSRGRQEQIPITVYRSDSWGTKNTATGEYREGKPYDYVNFEGKNPKYTEQMQPVDSRALWERYIR